MATKKPKENATYLLSFRDGTKQKVTLPAGCKLTFGPLCPGSKDAAVNSSAATALRVYEGANQQAVFTNVESFRNLSFAIEQEVTKTQAETFYKDTPEGKKQVVVEGTTREWINPDKPGAAPTEPVSRMQRLLRADSVAGEPQDAVAVPSGRR